VARGEGGRLVHEEKLGVLSGLEKRTPSIFEGQLADDPTVSLLEPLNVSVTVVETTPVTKPCSTLWNSVKKFKRVNAVFQWHSIPPSPSP
jgi:hypothetical protein